MRIALHFGTHQDQLTSRIHFFDMIFHIYPSLPFVDTKTGRGPKEGQATKREEKSAGYGSM